MSIRSNDLPPQLEEVYPSTAAPAISIADVLATLYRGWRFIVIGCLVGLTLAISFLVYAPTLYKSNARLLIDLSVNRYLQSNKIVDEPTFHQAEIGSQVYILSSESVVVPVVRSMNLVQDSEFVGPPNTGDGNISKLKSFVKGLIGWDSGAGADALDPEAARERTVCCPSSGLTDRATLPPSLCLRRGIFDGCADADRVRIRLVTGA